ncbi:MAG: hypothetical protein F4074_05070 [Synechococcus sp. SB0672_bin_10]|nr:hypothetical protein [Synechococcus sp. SB0672_bin_10]
MPLPLKRRLVLATGHHRNGVLLAAVTAELTRVVLEKESTGLHNTPWATPFLHAFRWNRFSSTPAQGSLRQD